MKKTITLILFALVLSSCEKEEVRPLEDVKEARPAYVVPVE